MIDTTNRNTALASALVEELARCGVQRAFLSPGSRSSPIALALDREPGLDLSVFLDERVAGFAALGAALADGTPTIVACTSGSAAANLHPAVVEADQAGVPLIVLTSDRPPELRGIGAGQTIDQIGLYGSAARWFCEVGTHDADDGGLLHLRSTGCRAYGEATSKRGPVHLNLSWRDPLGSQPAPDDLTANESLALEGRTEGRPLTVLIDAREPSDDLLVALVEAIDAAERGLIVVGRLTDHRLSHALGELSEQTGFPILAEPTSQLRFGNHDRSGVIAAYDLLVRSQPRDLAPDLVLRFGDMPTSKPLRTWIEGSAVDQIAIDPPGEWNEPSRRAGALLRADALAVIDGLRPLLGAAEGNWRRRWIDAERSAQIAIDEALSESEGINEPAIHRLLGDVYGSDERVLLASSMPIRDAEAFLRGGNATVTFHANRGANGIDGLIAAGCGIAVASGEPTWIVLGDLAIAHDLGGLAAADAVDSPLRIVVIDNGGGGIFDFLPQAGEVEPTAFERLFTTPSRLDPAQVASLFGFAYQPITDLTQLNSLGGEHRVLAHVAVDREGNVALHRRIAAAVSATLPQ